MITKGTYTTSNSDLIMVIINIQYRGIDYVKAKIETLNKHNGISYGVKNWKLYYKNIDHWEKVGLNNTNRSVRRRSDNIP
jgi:hypothetical protein